MKIMHEHVFPRLYIQVFTLTTASTYNPPGEVCRFSKVDIFDSISYKHFHYGG